jgi:mRNA-degrading endonuclease RelE of RelBE toxin-antitoxin system
MDKINKFLSKLTKSERLIIQNILRDLLVLKLENYDVKQLKGHKGVFRLRKGNIRIVFIKENETGIILDIDYRKDIYKK